MGYRRQFCRKVSINSTSYKGSDQGAQFARVPIHALVFPLIPLPIKEATVCESHDGGVAIKFPLIPLPIKEATVLLQ